MPTDPSVASRDVTELHPTVQAKLRDHLDLCATDPKLDALGVGRVLCIETFRSTERQRWLYAQGRTRPGKVVTKLTPGKSAHGYRVAYDLVPLDRAGRAWWAAPPAVWDRIALHGRAVGMEAGHNWKTFRDSPHFQFLGGRQLSEFWAGYRLPGDPRPCATPERRP